MRAQRNKSIPTGVRIKVRRGKNPLSTQIRNEQVLVFLYGAAARGWQREAGFFARSVRKLAESSRRLQLQRLVPHRQTRSSTYRLVAPRFPAYNAKCKKWSESEDVTLCKAFCNISNDGAVGTDQSVKTFWSRIKEAFDTANGGTTRRAVTALQNRWSSLINPDVKLLCALMAVVSAFEMAMVY